MQLLSVDNDISAAQLGERTARLVERFLPVGTAAEIENLDLHLTVGPIVNLPLRRKVKYYIQSNADRRAGG